MKILFDEKLAEDMGNRYMVLELDTVFHEGMNDPITLHAVVDSIPIEEISLAEGNRELHRQLILYYKSGEWDNVRALIPFLLGKWNGELDSFYENILEFVSKSDVGSWKGIRNTDPDIYEK